MDNLEAILFSVVFWGTLILFCEVGIPRGVNIGTSIKSAPRRQTNRLSRYKLEYEETPVK